MGHQRVMARLDRTKRLARFFNFEARRTRGDLRWRIVKKEGLTRWDRPR